MVKTITIANYNRPDCFRRCVDALRAQEGINWDDWTIYVVIDGKGGKERQLEKIYDSIDFCHKGLSIARKNNGVNASTYFAMLWAFEKSDLNVYLEDDIILSPDALRMAEWFAPMRGEYAVMSLCNVTQPSSEDVEGLYETDRFIGWGFVMGRKSWLKYAKDVWCAGESMWDNRLAQNIRDLGGKNLIPWKSRATNIGNEGEHFKPEFHKKFMEGHTYLEEYRECKYQIR